MNHRNNEARWSEKDKRWHIYVQSNGNRHHFASSVGMNSRKGKIEAEKKADKWLETQLSDENQKVEILYDKWIESLKERTQTAYWKQYESYGKVWIKPLIGCKRMNRLNENDLDKVIADAYKKGLAHKSLCNIRSCLVSFLKYARNVELQCSCRTILLSPKTRREAKENVYHRKRLPYCYQAKKQHAEASHALTSTFTHIVFC